MKAPPKRKGNSYRHLPVPGLLLRLNESPSEKEGKFRILQGRGWHVQGLNESPSEKEGKYRGTSPLVLVSKPQ